MKKVFLLFTAMLLHLLAQADSWNGSASDKTWYDETKTEFQIYNAAQLKGLADLVNQDFISFEGKTIFLQSDIDLNNRPWAPIGRSSGNPFSGIFDGLNHSINNLYIDSREYTPDIIDNVGLFGYASKATIKNFSLQGALYIVSGRYIGGVAAHAKHVENIYSDIQMNFYTSMSSSSIGTVVGIADEMEKISSKGEIRFTESYRGVSDGCRLGGIVGYCPQISECFSSVKIYTSIIRVSSPGGIGGISGYSSNISNAIFTGVVSVGSYNLSSDNFIPSVGGICGHLVNGDHLISAPQMMSYGRGFDWAKSIVTGTSGATITDTYYVNTWAKSNERYGTSISEDYLKSGAVLNGFDTNIWEFKAGKYPRLKSLIPTYAINVPTEHGSIAYCVTEGGEAKIKINSNQDWEIDKVFVNQMDVTSQMNGSMLIFEDIQENKDLFVVYKQTPSNVRSLQQNASFDISKTAEGFQVSGVQLGKTIAVYDLNGMELVRQSSNGKNLFALPKGLYIISACGQSKKVSF